MTENDHTVLFTRKHEILRLIFRTYSLELPCALTRRYWPKIGPDWVLQLDLGLCDRMK